jgi:hypothetical protein
MSCRANARSPDATHSCSILRVIQPSWVDKVISVTRTWDSWSFFCPDARRLDRLPLSLGYLRGQVCIFSHEHIEV